MFNVVFDHGGHRVITGSDDRLVKVWSAESGLLLFTCAGAQDAITQIEVNCNDTLVAAGSLDGYIRVWRLADGTPTAVLKGAPAIMKPSISFYFWGDASPRPAAQRPA